VDEGQVDARLPVVGRDRPVGAWCLARLWLWDPMEQERTATPFRICFTT